MTLSSLLVCFLLGIVAQSTSLENGVALTPPMGWMSWQRYRCIIDCETYPDECISEKMFRKAADLMVSEGYLAAGYEYVIIDDCWLEMERDKEGRLQPDRKRFPSGIKALADYVHSKGLKFGIYEDYGTKTCAGYPGVLGSLEIDAKTFGEWDVDYVKLDGCFSDTNTYPVGYPEFGKYLNETGRPMVYSCSWPAYEEMNGVHSDYEAIAKSCNLWRNYGDIDDSWGSVTTILDWFAKHQDRFIPYAGPGHWNDPDMLVLGNFGLNYEQSRAQMALWAVMAAPLIMSNDLQNVRPEIKAILQHKDIIAINKDPLGAHGKRVYKKDKIQIWVKPILPKIGGEESYAIVVLNRKVHWQPELFSIELKELGLNAKKYKQRDVYEPEKSPSKPSSTLNVYVNPTGVVVIIAEPTK